jgi:hypothetical protein
MSTDLAMEIPLLLSLKTNEVFQIDEFWINDSFVATFESGSFLGVGISSERLVQQDNIPMFLSLGFHGWSSM